MILYLLVDHSTDSWLGEIRPARAALGERRKAKGENFRQVMGSSEGPEPTSLKMIDESWCYTNDTLFYYK